MQVSLSLGPGLASCPSYVSSRTTLARFPSASWVVLPPTVVSGAPCLGPMHQPGSWSRALGLLPFPETSALPLLPSLWLLPFSLAALAWDTPEYKCNVRTDGDEVVYGMRGCHWPDHSFTSQKLINGAEKTVKRTLLKSKALLLSHMK